VLAFLFLNCVPVSPLPHFVGKASAEDTNTSNLKGPASYQWPESPGRGYGGLYIEDDISHTRKVSTLGNSSGLLCASTTDSSCAGQSVKFYAILPRCESSTSIDCVESISAKSASGTIEEAQFERYFPAQGLSDFVGSPEAKIPSGASSSLWNIPSAPHAGGTGYLAVVSVSGSADLLRTSVGTPLVHASLYPVQIVAGRFSRNIPNGVDSISHPSLDLWGNCAAIDDGYCAARQEFPSAIRFSMAIRLTSSPNGWLHGRIFDPEISFTKTDTSVRIQIEANPVQVPAIATWAESSLLPKSAAFLACTAEIFCSQSNPQSEGAVSSVEDWRPLYQDKASWTRGQWMFKTLSGGSALDSNTCFSDKSLLQGFVTTNSTGYSAGPPSYSRSEKSFTYTLSSPHFDAEGKVFVGSYSFVIRASTARCLYGIADGEISAKLTIYSSDQEDLTQTLTESVSIDATWLKVNASGFHYSSPVVKTSLFAPAVATPAVATPAVATPAVATPAVATPAITTRKPATAKSIAIFAKIPVLSTSKVSLKVFRNSTKYCKVSGATLKGLKAGPCKVTVTVSPKKGRPTFKNVTLQITK
jgi:hypothetical protein